MDEAKRTVIGPVSAFALAKEAGYTGTAEQWAGEQAVAANVLSQIIAGVHTGNRLNNADFTQWVAQGGICRKHANGSVVFAGDRWELKSGTLTATANEYGNGYNDVTLNGVIRQRALMPPEHPCFGVFVKSGTAYAEYKDGVLSITGENAVLDCAYLYDYAGDVGNTPVRPVKRGYAAELMDCLWFYQYIPSLGEISLVSYVFSVGEVNAIIRATMPLPAPMRLAEPTMGYYYRTSSSVLPHNVVPISVSTPRIAGGLLTMVVQVEKDVVNRNDMLAIKPNATIELSADLLC